MASQDDIIFLRAWKNPVVLIVTTKNSYLQETLMEKYWKF